MNQINLLKVQADFIQYLEKTGKSFNTLKNYQSDLQCFNKYLLTHKSNLQLKSLNSDEAQAYGEYLNSKYDSSNSIRRRLQALRLFFDFLIKNHSFPENPMKAVLSAPKIVLDPLPLAFHHLLKLDQYFKDQIEKNDDFQSLIAFRNRVIVHLIYGSGLKVSDLSTLKRSDVFLNGKNPRVMVRPLKREPYSIPLMKGSLSLFEKYLPHLIDDLFLFNANAYKIFPGGLSPRGIELMFKSIHDELKIPVTAKNLRLSCIYRWMNEGRSESTIKEWMGVAPAYSLDSYFELRQKNPEDFFFQGLSDE
jgi:site-specific recombinase XerD